MTIIRAGLLNQSIGRGPGTCDGASAPGSLTFSIRRSSVSTWKQRARSLQATATVAMWVPRRAAVLA
jgi:hypothetical protein